MSVIFVVADGTGFSHYSVLFQDPVGRKIFKQFQYSILVNTSPPTSKRPKSNQCISTRGLTPVTESASSATAMSTGKWVPHGNVSIDKNGNKLKTITEEAKQKKKIAFGIICTTDFFDATPASFFAHGNREDEKLLAQQVLNFGLDVLVSGGQFMSSLARSQTTREYSKLEYVAKNRTVRSVSHHLKSALTKMNNKFFLFVEESLIDVESHHNNRKKTACELTSLMYTIQTALKYTNVPENKTTLILVSDHSTGAAIVDNIKSQNSSHLRFTSKSHDGHIVPLFISGYRSKSVMDRIDSALIDMVDIHDILRFLLRL
jgi:alkaline phosphatase